MINYKEITGVSVGEVHFTPDMVIQACKDSVKASIPLILEAVVKNVTMEQEIYSAMTGRSWKEEKTYISGEYGDMNLSATIKTSSITSLQDTLEKQLGI